MAGLKRRGGGYSPYAYRPGNSPLHRAPPALKLLALLGISTAAFFFGLPAAAAAALLLCVAAIPAGIRPWELLRGVRPLFVMLLLILAFRSLNFDPLGFNPRGFWEALEFTGNVLVSFSAGTLFFAVTTMTQIRESLEAVRIPQLRGRRKPRGLNAFSSLNALSLGLSLMLGFLPRFFEVWEEVRCAYEARGGRKGIPFLRAVIPRVTEGMIEIAGETAAALEARGISLRF
jgi:biotin transport system permease protein